MEKVPAASLEVITPAEVVYLKAETLANLEEIVDAGLESVRAGTLAYAALATIHQKNLYGESFEDYCYERFGISRSSGWRWVKVGRAILAAGKDEPPSQRSLTKKKDETAGQRVPRARHEDDRAGADDTPASEAQPTPRPGPDSNGSTDVARGSSPSPDGSTSARGAQEPSPLPQPKTKDDYRRLVALVVTAGPAVLAQSVEEDQLVAAGSTLNKALGKKPGPPPSKREERVTWADAVIADGPVALSKSVPRQALMKVQQTIRDALSIMAVEPAPRSAPVRDEKITPNFKKSMKGKD